jgi:lysophosphatidate acyltransferase
VSLQASLVFVYLVQVLFDGDFEEIFSKKENAIYLANHQSTGTRTSDSHSPMYVFSSVMYTALRTALISVVQVDWVLSDMVAVRQGSLGNLRYVMKSSLQQLPLYGLYFYEHGCIYVNRGHFDPEKMINGLSYLQHPKINVSPRR